MHHATETQSKLNGCLLGWRLLYRRATKGYEKQWKNIVSGTQNILADDLISHSAFEILDLSPSDLWHIRSGKPCPKKLCSTSINAEKAKQPRPACRTVQAENTGMIFRKLLSLTVVH
jgi:hypothetical protein